MSDPSHDDDGRLSRRNLLRAGAVSGVAALTGGAAGPAAAAACGNAIAPSDDPEDIVLVNGRIHTMDDQNRVVASVAIRNGKFIYVGHDGRPASPNATVIDLRGRTVVPGIIERHVHIVSMANRLGYHTPIESATSISRGAADARRAAPRRARRPVDHRDGRLAPEPVHRRAAPPTRSELDAAVSDRPVMMFEQLHRAGASSTASARRSSRASLAAGRAR